MKLTTQPYSGIIEEERVIQFNKFFRGFTSPEQREWKHYLKIREYFTSLFNNTTDNEEFEEIETELFRWLFELGEIFVTYENEEFHIYRIIQKYCEGLHVRKVKVDLLTAEHFSYEPGKVLPPPRLRILTNKEDGLYLTVKTLSDIYPGYFWWAEYCKTIVELEDIFLNAARMQNKKFIYTRNTDSKEVAELEMKSFLDPNIPFIENIGSLGLGKTKVHAQNVITPYDKGASNMNETFEALMNYKNYMYDLNGLMAQMELKKERKTTSETNMDVYNTRNNEDLTLRNLNKFARQASKLWGVELAFERTTDITEQTDDKETEEAVEVEQDD